MRKLEQNRPKKQQQKSRIDPVFIEDKFYALGFKKLTDIQKKSIHVIYQKKDSLIVAPTGSGKTECAVIPIFDRIRKSKKHGMIKMLYITPLRALNRDIFRRIIRYAEFNNLSIEIRHGDTSQSVKRRITKNPPDILITTPETLVILLTQKLMLNALSELEWVVIDEVHELLSSERGSQLSLSLERLQINTKSEITRIGLSATIGNVTQAAKFIVGTKRKCKILQDSSLRKYDIDVKFVDGSISDVAQYIIDYVKKLDLKSPILLFTNTRGEAEFLASILRDKSSINIELHHGSLSKNIREESESFLRENKSGIVVCTSSLELGIDIGSIELVIHHGSPRQVSKLVQRIGRSKHSHGFSAKGLIVTNNVDDEFETMAILQRVKEGDFEEQEIHFCSLDVLAHHLVGLTMQLNRDIQIEFAYETFRKAFPFRTLTLEDLVGVIELLDSNYLLFFDRKKMCFWKKSRAFVYYFKNLSTIPDILKFKVFDSIGKKIIGTLDQKFVGDYGESGNIFVLRGTQWRILNIDEKSLTVNVEQIRNGKITIPHWEGESIPVDFNTSRKVGSFRTKVVNGSLKAQSTTISKLNFDIIPNEHNIVIESSRTEGIVVIHACFGSKINFTLSALLSSMFSSLIGSMVDSRSDAYRITLSSNYRITKKLFQEILHDEYDLETIIATSLTGTHNINWRTWCVAKKFGIVERESVYERKSSRFLYERYINTQLVKEALRELYHDKFDLVNTTKILEKIRNNEIKIVWYEVNIFSDLAEPILDHTTKYYSSPSNIDKGILDMIKDRLQKTKHRLICCRCGKWERMFETNEIKSVMRCPYCRGKQITITFYSDYDLSKIIQKKYLGKKLSAEENHKFIRAWKISSLFENFGKNAILVISGYGIGADTAARILRDMTDEENLYKQIYQAERQYIMTRGFWDY